MHKDFKFVGPKYFDNAFTVTLTKQPNPRSMIFLYFFSFSEHFIVVPLIFRIWAHLELSFECGLFIRVPLHSFACQYPISQHRVLKRSFLSELDSLGTLAGNQLTR
jgi:hypothetical protein